jgi:D-hexose-6-phosphate mutarotase
MMQIDELNRRLAAPGQLDFEELPGGLAVARVSTPWASATVALQGAHVMTFRPDGQAPVIWLSGDARFLPGKSIRGGVPVCWPWFGPHAENSGFPGHGFARTVPWQVLAAAVLPDGRVRLEFELVQTEATRIQWPHASTVRNLVTVGPELEVELVTTNTGDQPFTLGQALHTYFEIGDIRQVAIGGLEGCDYLDKVDGGARKRQHGEVRFSQETDRIYLATRGCCEIRDPLLKRRILVTSTGSRSTVVWNPWVGKAERMGDFGANGHLNMVCVETANAADDVVRVGPGQVHRLAAQYRVLPA